MIKNGTNEAERPYPKRTFLRADEEIERLRKIESGEIECLELSVEERKEVLEFEDLLGKELEPIGEIKITSRTFYPEYFLTEKGRADFSDVIGMKISGETADDVTRSLFANRESIGLVSGKELSGLAGRSRLFSEDAMLDGIMESMGEDGSISIDGLENPKRANIILNPGEALRKMNGLRSFKRGFLSERMKGLSGTGNADDAKRRIAGLYRQKVNVMIAGQAGDAIWAAKLSDLIGREGLAQEEADLARSVPGIMEFERTLFRYDRFIHGSDDGFDEKGMERQVGKELSAYADKLEEEYEANVLERNDRIREKGLDPDKLSAKSVTLDEFSGYANGLLEHYGEKSAYPPEQYDPNRAGPAPDEKWQFIAREEYRSMSVGGKQKVIKSGVGNKTVTETLGVLLGHEFAHFLQNLNKDKVSLRLFSDKLGGFRSAVFSEGGAMETESAVCKELFGYEVVPHPHYIRAMVRKLEGGTYLDCVKAFYDSGIKGIRKRKEKGVIIQEDFMREATDMAKLAIDRVKRLFAASDDLGRCGQYLAKSKDTAYAEQMITMEKLRGNGLEKCAFVGGMTPGILAELAEMGLVDLDEIRKPDLEPIRRIWEEKRAEYL